MRIVKYGYYFFIKLQITVLIILLSCTTEAQYKNLWMSAGSLHNWYSAIGSEIEEGWVLQKDVTIDHIDETMIWDRMIENVCNTQLGLTMTRKIFQFSQQFHDNYIVYEYTFTNTGNVDADTVRELPNQ